MTMDDAVTLDQAARLALADDLTAANGTVLLAVDPIDGGVKLKIAGRWTPAYGSMPIPEARDPGRNVADDLRQERLAIVPPWYQRGDELPGKDEL